MARVTQLTDRLALRYEKCGSVPNRTAGRRRRDDGEIFYPDVLKLMIKILVIPSFVFVLVSDTNDYPLAVSRYFSRIVFVILRVLSDFGIK